MAIADGFKKFKKYIVNEENKHVLQSLWTSSDTVYMKNKTNVTLTSEMQDVKSNVSTNGYNISVLQGYNTGNYKFVVVDTLPSDASQHTDTIYFTKN